MVLRLIMYKINNHIKYKQLLQHCSFHFDEKIAGVILEPVFL